MDVRTVIAMLAMGLLDGFLQGLRVAVGAEPARPA